MVCHLSYIIRIERTISVRSILFLIIIEDIVLIDMEAAMIDDRPMKSISRSIFDFMGIIIIRQGTQSRQKYLEISIHDVRILLEC